MLERVELTNFQCHKKLALDFDRITTLVGASDSGKTAVLRALDWVCFNRGRTALLLRRGENNMTVKLKVDGKTITRTTKQNSYWIDDQQLSTIGRTQPMEISNIMRMVEENVQRQHDYLFWFACNGSGLVQQLNRVVDLTELDGWVREGVSRERRSKDKIDAHVEERKEKTDKRDALLVNRDADRELKVLEDFTAKYSAAKDKYDVLAKLMNELTAVEVEQAHLTSFIGDLTAVVSMAEDVSADADRKNKLGDIVDTIAAASRDTVALTSMLADWEKTSACWDALQTISERNNALSGMVNSVQELAETEEKQRYFTAAISDVVKVAGEVEELRDKYSALTSMLDTVNKPVPDLTPLKDTYDECIAVNERYSDMSGLLNTFGDLLKQEAKQQQETADIRKDFNEQSEGICPICGGKLDDGCISSGTDKGSDG